MKQINPLMWGVVAAILAAAIVSIGWLTNQPPSSNQLLENPISAAAIAFFWGWAAGKLKIWYGERLKR